MRRWIRYTARALALIWAGWWTLFGLLAGIGEGYGPEGVLLHMAIPGLLFLLAAAVAWRWELIGALMLGFEGALTLLVFPFARTPVGFLMLALPPLLAGGLFFAHWVQSDTHDVLA
jgi:hypothetical protein